MKETQYEGKPCKHGHLNENGKTIRSIKTKKCIACDREFARKNRIGNESYKQYQKEYHARLRRENPERLKEYRATQVERGHVRGNGYIPVDKREAFTRSAIVPYTRKKYLSPTQLEELTTMNQMEYASMSAVAQMLFSDMRKAYVNTDGTLNDKGIAEGWTNTTVMDADLLLKARRLVNPSIHWTE